MDAQRVGRQCEQHVWAEAVASQLAASLVWRWESREYLASGLLFAGGVQSGPRAEAQATSVCQTTACAGCVQFSVCAGCACPPSDSGTGRV